MPGDGISAPSKVVIQPFVDAAFRVHGDAIPIDHGYHLYGALSRCVPAIHEHRDWGVHPVTGMRSGPDRLALTRGSRLRMRLPAAEIAEILPLAGQMLDIRGHEMGVGVPEIGLLTPRPGLRARLVTIKGYDAPETFAAAARRQLEEIAGPAAGKVTIEVKERRVLRIHGHIVVGFAMTLDNLDEDTSLAVQARGIGGRRLMGCGVFVPPRPGEP